LAASPVALLPLTQGDTVREADDLIATIKRLLRQEGKTYRDLAQTLNLSEASVKRMFANGQFSLERIGKIATLLGYTIAEIAVEASTIPRISSTTMEQETELASDSKLLLVAICAVNNWTADEIVNTYRLSNSQCLQYLLRLDRLRLIELHHGDRIRPLITRDFCWIPNGPVAQMSRVIQREFIDEEFTADYDTLTFLHGMLSDGSLERFQSEIRRLGRLFDDLIQEDRAVPIGHKSWVSVLIAGRRNWEPQALTALRR